MLDYLIETLINEDERLRMVTIPESLESKKVLFRALRNIREPKKLDEEYLKREDEYLQSELKKKEIVSEKDIPMDRGILSIWKGDITTLIVEAIVNAGNEYMLGCFIPNHFCVDNFIHSNAGSRLRLECDKIMNGKTISNGSVILTKAYNLPSRYVIHTLGPQVNYEVNEKDKLDLANCYYNSLEIAKENNIKTIAFPCISTGLFAFPNELACEIAIKTVKDYLKNNPNVFKHIIFNVFKDEDLMIYQERI